MGDKIDIVANIMFMFKFELFRWDLAASDLPDCRPRKIADFGLCQMCPFKRLGSRFMGRGVEDCRFLAECED